MSKYRGLTPVFFLALVLCGTAHAQEAVEPLTLRPGELRTLPVQDVERIAIGDPAIVDVTIVSTNEVLIQGKAPGTTNLILWDGRGQTSTNIRVLDKDPAALVTELENMLREIALPNVKVTREGDRIFLTGTVSHDADLEKLEEMMTSYRGVTNLVSVPEPGSLTPETGPMSPTVKLSVQIIEISRSDLEELGVDWSDSVGVTHPATTDLTVNQALFQWGSVNRTSIAASLSALVEKNRARILSEPKLVTASGKEAESFIGLEVPIVTATSFGTATSTVSASIEFRQTGVLLKMTPTVHSEPAEEGAALGAPRHGRRITTAIESEVSSIDNSVALAVPVGSDTVTVPGFKVKKASTEVTVNSGETIMIAGLLEVSDTNNSTQVPALGSMPIFGRLFRKPEIESTQRELVIAVTPELVQGSGPALAAPRPGPVTAPTLVPPTTSAAMRGVLAPPTAPMPAAQHVAQAPRVEIPAAAEDPAALPIDFDLMAPIEEPFVPAPIEPLATLEMPAPPAAPEKARIPEDIIDRAVREAPPRAMAEPAGPKVSTNVTLPVNEPRLNYALDVHDRIARAIVAPRNAEGSGTVKLKLHIRRDGTLLQASVAQSSTNPQLDTAVLRAANAQAPYPAFPAALAEQDLWLEIPVTFEPR